MERTYRLLRTSPSGLWFDIEPTHELYLEIEALFARLELREAEEMKEKADTEYAKTHAMVQKKLDAVANAAKAYDKKRQKRRGTTR